MTYAPTKFEGTTSKSLGEMHLQKKIHHLTFDLYFGVKVTLNVAQFPLHHVTYSASKFAVATSNALGGDTFTR